MKPIRHPLPTAILSLALGLPLLGQTGGESQPPSKAGLSENPPGSPGSPGSRNRQDRKNPPAESLPAPLSLPPEPSAAPRLDLLPAFPPGPSPAEAPDLPSFNFKRRDNLSLVPDGPNPTEEAALALVKRQKFQEARRQALNDPAVRDALNAAQKARSDRELRELLRQHYTLLFKKIRALDPSLESLVKERENAALEPLADGIASRAAAVGKK
jgi:hypothetical protein